MKDYRVRLLMSVVKFFNVHRNFGMIEKLEIILIGEHCETSPWNNT